MKKRIGSILASVVLLCGIVNANGLEEFEGKSFSPPSPTTAYSYKDGEGFTTWNKTLMGASVATFGVGDTLSTRDMLSRGCIELNPIFGKHPSTGFVVAAKVLYFGAAYYITEEYLVPRYGTDARNWVYGSTAIVGAALTVHNYNLECN